MYKYYLSLSFSLLINIRNLFFPLLDTYYGLPSISPRRPPTQVTRIRPVAASSVYPVTEKQQNLLIAAVGGLQSSYLFPPLCLRFHRHSKRQSYKWQLAFIVKCLRVIYYIPRYSQINIPCTASILEFLNCKSDVIRSFNFTLLNFVNGLLL